MTATGSPRSLVLTCAQQRCLLIEELFPGSSVNTLGGTVRLTGGVDIQRLNDAFQAAVREFDSFRTIFAIDAGEPHQLVTPFVPAKLEHVDFSQVFEGAPSYAAFEAWAQVFLEKPLRMDQGELYRCVLFSLAADVKGYLIKIHHSIADGWSMSLMTSFVKRAYESADPTRYGESSPPFEEAVRAESEYLKSSRFERDRQFWAQRLAHDLDALPERRAKTESAGGRISIALSPGESSRVRRVSAQLGCSVNVLFVSLFAVYRAHIHGASAGVVAIPLLNRHSRRDRQRFGMLATHLPLTYRLRSEESFAEVAARLRADFHACYRHSRLPSQWMRPEGTDGDCYDLFDYAVNYYRFDHDPQVGSLRQQVDEYYSGQQSFALQLVIREWAQEQSVSLCFDYLHALYDQMQIRSMQRGLIAILSQVAESPEVSLGELRVLPEEELRHRARWLVGERRASGERSSFPQLFMRAVRQHPDRCALLEGTAHVSYRQLARRSARFARRLQDLGVRPGDRVALLCARSPQAVIALAGILRMGAVLVPLDAQQPAASLRSMCEQARVRAVVHDSVGAQQAQALGRPCYALGGPEEGSSGELPASGPCLDALAYVLFTSGSTGTPKGVEIEHRSLSNYLCWSASTYYRPGDVAALVSPLTVDLTVTSLLTPLVAGATIRVYGEEVATEVALETAVEQDRVTVLKLTPSHLMLLLAMETEAGRVRTIVVGGEDFRTRLAQRCRARFPLAAIYNEYGPTEATVGCMAYLYEEACRTETVPLGSPVAKTEIRLLSPWGAATPVGEVGEIHVVGEAVGRGYLGSPEPGRDRFYLEAGGAARRCYRTGDLARLVDRTTLVVAGRIDRQVKLRGHRVELGGIEAALLSGPGVQSAAAFPIPAEEGAVSHLAAAVTPRAVDAGALREHLAARLPPYAIPAAIRVLPSLPLRDSGKVDFEALRARFQAPEDGAPAEGSSAKLVQSIVSRVLGREDIGPDANLIAYGLDSIRSVQIAALLRAEGYAVRPGDVLGAASIRSVASTIAKKQALGVAEPSLEPAGAGMPATPIIHWFLGQDLPEPDRYCQIAVLRLRRRVCEEDLRNALRTLPCTHPALRLGLRRGEDRLFLAQAAPEPLVEVVESARMDGEALGGLIERLSGRLDLTAGRVFAAVLVNGGQAQLLVLCAHHVAVDVHSWFLLLQDLDALLRSPGPGIPVTLRDGYLDWAHYLRRKTPEVARADAAYWQRVLAVPEPGFRPPAVSVSAPVGRQVLEVPAATVASLSEHGRRWLGADLHALLLSVLAASLAPWSSGPACRIEVEGLGRGLWPDQPETAMAVGWFTSLYPFVLPTRGLPWDRLVTEIMRGLAAVPAGGASYGMLKYLAGGLDASPTLLRFNFLGQALQLHFDCFEVDPEWSGLVRGPVNPLDCAVSLEIAVSAGGLRAHADFSCSRIDSAEVRALLDAYRRGMDELCMFLAKQTKRRWATTDYEAVHLSDEDLVGLFGSSDADPRER